MEDEPNAIAARVVNAIVKDLDDSIDELETNKPQSSVGEAMTKVASVILSNIAISIGKEPRQSSMPPDPVITAILSEIAGRIGNKGCSSN